MKKYQIIGIPASDIDKLINEWILNQKYRKIIHDRLINGDTYELLSEKYDMSVRQIANIIKICCIALKSHINDSKTS